MSNHKFKSCAAMGSLMVGASFSRPKGLGSMPDVTKYPSSTHGWRNSPKGLRPTVLISVYVTISDEVRVQMFRSSGQSNMKSQCSASKQAWYTFIDPLKRGKAELTLPSPGLELQTSGWKA
ncbi:hypothetical protein TNCV_3329941 [Trichonephila clavipes]|nr:hypothetical protein TNCV_3329941 [Trichonephila clavipes]